MSFTVITFINTIILFKKGGYLGSFKFFQEKLIGQLIY